MRSRKPNGVRQSATWPTATAASAISTPTCRSVPRTSRPSHDAAGRSGDWGKPEPGSPRSPCRTSLTIKSPTKFRSRVARTSWTPRLSRMPAASPAQAAPASTPPPSAQSVAIGRGAGTMWSATQVAASPPSASWPSPPMLMTRARKHSAMPTPVRAYGVARFRPTAMRSHEPNAPWASDQYASSGFFPAATIRIPVTPNARSTASSGGASARTAARSTRRLAGGTSTHLPPVEGGGVGRLAQRARHHEAQARDVDGVSTHHAGEAAAVHDGDPVGDDERFLELGRHVEHGATAGADGEHLVDHEAGRAGIEAPSRLRRDQHAWTASELAGQHELLLVATRQRARGDVGATGPDAEARDALGRRGAHGAEVEPRSPAERRPVAIAEGEVLAHGHVADQARRMTIGGDV